MNATLGPDDVDLDTTAWNYHRPLYPSKLARFGCVVAPVWVVAFWFFWSEAAFWTTALLMLVASLLVIRSQRGAYATPSGIHRRKGFFGLSSERIPLTSVDDVFVTPVSAVVGKALGNLGDLTLKCGQRYVVFECIANASAARERILEMRDRIPQAQAPREG